MRNPPWRILLLVVLGALALACRQRTYVTVTAPTAVPTTPAVVKHTIQFRVLGNPTSVRVRYSTPVDGLGQVVTSLPYFNTVTLTGDSLFLSLEGTPISWASAIQFPFLSIQIVVDNVVFREATSQEFNGAPLATSGQWHQ